MLDASGVHMASAFLDDFTVGGTASNWRLMLGCYTESYENIGKVWLHAKPLKI